MYQPIMNSLWKFAESRGYIVRFKNLQINNGRLKGNRIALRQGMNNELALHVLAHEIAHAFLHYDKGNTITSEKHAEYEEQAERCAELIIELLRFISG